MASKSNHRRVRYDRILAVLLVLILLIVLLVKCCSSCSSNNLLAWISRWAPIIRATDPSGLRSMMRPQSSIQR